MVILGARTRGCVCVCVLVLCRPEHGEYPFRFQGARAPVTSLAKSLQWMQWLITTVCLPFVNRTSLSHAVHCLNNDMPLA